MLKIKIYLKNKDFSAFKLPDVVFVLLTNVKMPTIVGILTFISRINFMLSEVEHEKSSEINKSAPEIFVPNPLLSNEDLGKSAHMCRLTRAFTA